MRASGARLAIFFDEGWESGPVILSSDRAQSSLGCNDLKGDDCVSTGEHVVEDCPSQGHVCILNAKVDCQRFRSIFSLCKLTDSHRQNSKLLSQFALEPVM